MTRKVAALYCNRMFFRRAIAILVGIAALSCSEPPTNERNQADGAIAAALAADAATYAPEELATAQAAVAKYDAAVANRDYRLALNLAVEARDGAYEAAKRASNAKAAARSQAERLVVDLDGLTRTANARLIGAALPRPVGAAADRLRLAVAPAPVALQEARTGIDAGEYRVVVARLAPIVEELRKELGAPPPRSNRRGR